MKEKIVNHFNGNYQLFYKKFIPEVKQIGGNEYKTRCPFPNHEDKNASFCFNNSNGRYYCHGCDKKGDIFHFYGKINSLSTRHDFRKILRGIADDFGIAWEKQKSKLVKTYDYTDADGKLLFQVCRMEPKDFRQRQPNGKGWQWNLKGIEPVLYRLPEVIAAPEVVIVEGEKDADNVCLIGLCATTSPMGAKKWKDEYSEVLKGKHIVLIPDSDNEGREHTARVGASLNGHAASLKLLELPGLPSKGDVSDFLSTFTDKEEAAEKLSILIENAPPYEPPKKLTHEDVIIDVSQFSHLEIPERAEYLFPWLKESSINLVSGWRGCGKTWFALGIVDAVSRGASFGSWECKEPVPCLFVDGEMAPGDIKERIEALKLDSDRRCPLYIYSDAYASQQGIPRAHLTSEKWRTIMKRILNTWKVKLWVIDNIASLASGLDENAKKDWDPINQWLLELRFAGISTMMLHHVNKDGGQRGTSAREDNLDISLMLKKPPDYVPEDGARFIVHFSKARVQTSYLNEIADTEFKLIQDDSGQYIWTCKGVKAERTRSVLQMIDEGYDQKGIAESLGISKGYVSQIKKKAINDGLLSQKGKLTPSGFIYVAGN